MNTHSKKLGRLFMTGLLTLTFAFSGFAVNTPSASADEACTFDIVTFNKKTGKFTIVDSGFEAIYLASDVAAQMTVDEGKLHLVMAQPCNKK